MGVGWVVAIIVGGLAGWLAGKFVDVRFGLFMNILIGIVGAVIGNAVLAQFRVQLAGGWVGYLIAAFLGASILLFIVKLIRR